MTTPVLITAAARVYDIECGVAAVNEVIAEHEANGAKCIGLAWHRTKSTATLTFSRTDKQPAEKET